MKLLITCLLFINVITAQTWVRLYDLPGPERDDGVAVTVNNVSYFGTGYCSNGSFGGDFYALDPITFNWSSIAPMPAGTQRQYACAFAGPNCFFVFGGDGAGGSLNSLYKYDVSTNTWSTAASKPGIGLSGACCLAFGDKVLIVSGKTQGSAPVSDVWEYSISSNTWLQKNNFPFGGRFRASAAVLNGTGYLMFGADDHDHFRKDMYRYNQSSDTWTKLMDFPQPAARVYASLSPISNKLILFGGIDSTLTCYKDVWYYDPTNNSWEQSGDFASFARKGGMAAVAGSKFVYTCGIDQNSLRLKETWIADIPVGLQAQEKQLQLSVFPNPVTGLLHILIQENTTLTAVTLTDVSGKEIVHEKIQVNTASLDLGGLDKGIYFLRVQSGERVVWKKVVKE